MERTKLKKKPEQIQVRKKTKTFMIVVRLVTVKQNLRLSLCPLDKENDFGAI